MVPQFSHTMELVQLYNPVWTKLPFIKIFGLYLHAHTCAFHLGCLGAHKSQKWASVPLKMELQVFMSHPKWILGAKLVIWRNTRVCLTAEHTWIRSISSFQQQSSALSVPYFMYLEYSNCFFNVQTNFPSCRNARERVVSRMRALLAEGF